MCSFPLLGLLSLVGWQSLGSGVWVYVSDPGIWFDWTQGYEDYIHKHGRVWEGLFFWSRIVSTFSRLFLLVKGCCFETKRGLTIISNKLSAILYMISFVYCCLVWIVQNSYFYSWDFILLAILFIYLNIYIYYQDNNQSNYVV